MGTNCVATELLQTWSVANLCSLRDEVTLICIFQFVDPARSPGSAKVNRFDRSGNCVYHHALCTLPTQCLWQTAICPKGCDEYVVCFREVGSVFQALWPPCLEINAARAYVCHWRDQVAACQPCVGLRMKQGTGVVSRKLRDKREYSYSRQTDKRADSANECLAVIKLFWAKLRIGGRHRMLLSESRTVPKGVSEAWPIISTLARFVSNSAQYVHSNAELLRVLWESAEWKLYLTNSIKACVSVLLTCVVWMTFCMNYAHLGCWEFVYFHKNPWSGGRTLSMHVNGPTFSLVPWNDLTFGK
jgi:hypothetical protein